jgi:hypothetical protein
VILGRSGSEDHAGGSAAKATVETTEKPLADPGQVSIALGHDE